MKNIITIIIVLIVSLGHAQTTIKKSSIDSGGAIAQNGTISILYTVGELAVQETTNGVIHVSEGFLSADLQEALDVAGFSILEGVSVFPNPTIDYVSIQFTESANYSISLTDLNGKQLGIYETTESNAHRLDMTIYSSGVYLVTIKDNFKRVYKVYKIIKE